MQVSISEFRNNMKKYEKLAKKEDIEVLNHNKTIFVVKSPESLKKDAYYLLRGFLNTDVSVDDVMKNKLKEYENID